MSVYVRLSARQHQWTKKVCLLWGLEAAVVDDDVVRLRSWFKSDRIVLMMEIKILAFGAKENKENEPLVLFIGDKQCCASLHTQRLHNCSN